MRLSNAAHCCCATSGAVSRCSSRRSARRPEASKAAPSRAASTLSSANHAALQSAGWSRAPTAAWRRRGGASPELRTLVRAALPEGVAGQHRRQLLGQPVALRVGQARSEHLQSPQGARHDAHELLLALLGVLRPAGHFALRPVPPRLTVGYFAILRVPPTHFLFIAPSTFPWRLSSRCVMTSALQNARTSGSLLSGKVACKEPETSGT